MATTSHPQLVTTCKPITATGTRHTPSTGIDASRTYGTEKKTAANGTKVTK
jgi:hypothetical protein